MAAKRGGFEEAKPLGEMSAVERENAWDALMDSLETGDPEYDVVFARERHVARKIAHLSDEMDALRHELQNEGIAMRQRDQLERRIVALSRQSSKLERQAEKLQEQLALLAADD